MNKPLKTNRVGIIATIGPSCFSILTLKKMVKAGMTIGRINTKYGNEKQWETNIKKLHQVHSKVLVDIKKESILPWLVKQKIDYLAVSFAESKNQINKIRKVLPRKIKIISKIETQKGIQNLDNLLKVSDGLMVARGDLGKNISLEKVPIFQKLILSKCNKKRKIAITATEMLLSMVKSKTPERAEVSDVANAVLDGSNFLMLSEETAIGKYPAKAVSEMSKIINETLRNMNLLR
jgi:pyruvate kinase